MTFDFDTPPDRRGTDSQKWQKYAAKDILPMWVADMDFVSSPAILEALRTRVDHGVFGYARPTAATVEAVIGGMQSLYGWRVDPAWFVWLPGLVCGLNVTIDAFTEPGDEVLCLTPVYPPFIGAPVNRSRKAVQVPLVLSSGRWEIDWDALERSATPRSKIFLLCHPHNPVSRVWTPPELARLSEFCARRKILLCSDEIHCDLILDAGRRHVPTALAAPKEHASRILTYMAPSKTYNTPGLGTSFAIVPDAGLRARLIRACNGIVAEVTNLGYAACEAAYRDSEPWRQALLAYLRGNRAFLLDSLSRDLPSIRVEAPLEATYLAWLNVEGLKLKDPAGHFESHGVGLSDGVPYGDAPGRHLRINYGCPRSTLAEALRRMKAAL